jgi:hypothetical protein
MRTIVPIASAVVLVGALAACGAEPKLDIQQQSNAPAATAPQPAAQPAAPAPQNAPVETAPAHEPGAAEMPAGPAPVGNLPPGHPPMTGGATGMGSGMAMVPTVEPGAGQGASAIAWQTPAGWVAETPSNAMRRAQYKVSGPGGEGECVVFYFGPGQGGAPMANAERWAAQFADEKGQPAMASMKTRTEAVNGAQVLFVEAAGTYMSGGMMGDAVVPRPGWALLGAVVEGPDANWFFKFTAPAQTIEAERAAFEGMIRSVKHGG